MTTVTDLDSNVSSTDEVDVKQMAAVATVLDLAPSIVLEGHESHWTKFSLEDQLVFRNKLEALFTMVTSLRVKFDAQVWTGHDNGSVNTAVHSIRQRRNPDAAKPGRKAEPKSLIDQLYRK